MKYSDIKQSLPHQQVIAETYGEILPASIRRLMNIVQPTTHDVFVDLGSGMGKVVQQVFKETPVKEARGIEVIPELHQVAQQNVTEMSREAPEYFMNGRELVLILGDFLQTNLASATITLMGSPCFGPTMLDELASIIEKTPTIHTVLSLRPLLHLSRLSFKRALRVECSWDSAQCYLYKNT